jgi:hypothetical protein
MPEGPPAPPRKDGEVLSKSFEELYPTFLWRKSMAEGEKSSLWQREYRGRWVRWEGIITSFTTHGATFKHLLTTTTFDVSLTCDNNALKLAKSRFAPGDRVRYVARLDNYDDVFRTMYLTNGAIVEKVPPGDLGVPLDMSR